MRLKHYNFKRFPHYIILETCCSRNDLCNNIFKTKKLIQLYYKFRIFQNKTTQVKRLKLYLKKQVIINFLKNTTTRMIQEDLEKICNKLLQNRYFYPADELLF